MTVENPIQYEVELVERLWSQGWAAFRTASAGPGALANCDVVALKDGDALMLNVVVFENATSTEKVGEYNEDLQKSRTRARSNGINSDGGVVIGHAVKSLYDGEWFYKDTNGYKIRAHDDMPMLNEVTLG